MTIRILKAVRKKDDLIPEELFRTDDILVIGIRQYCKKFNLKPIYIHESVAIFEDHFLFSIYMEEDEVFSIQTPKS